MHVKPLALVVGTAAVAALTLISGIVHGRISQRWGLSSGAATAAEKLQTFPVAFGSWQMQSKNTFDSSTLNQLRCAGYISRIYQNQQTGTEANVAVLLGPPGEISVHTPEICFSSREFDIETKRQRLAVTNPDGSKEEFWTLDFRGNDLHARLVHVAYGWSTGNHWSAPEEPRFVFSGNRYLYKIQLAITGNSQQETSGENLCRQFLAEFAPAMRNYLLNPSRE
jgi:hypothetical protein